MADVKIEKIDISYLKDWFSIGNGERYSGPLTIINNETYKDAMVMSVAPPPTNKAPNSRRRPRQEENNDTTEKDTKPQHMPKKQNTIKTVNITNIDNSPSYTLSFSSDITSKNSYTYTFEGTKYVFQRFNTSNGKEVYLDVNQILVFIFSEENPEYYQELGFFQDTTIQKMNIHNRTFVNEQDFLNWIVKLEDRPLLDRECVLISCIHNTNSAANIHIIKKYSEYLATLGTDNIHVKNSLYHLSMVMTNVFK